MLGRTENTVFAGFFFFMGKEVQEPLGKFFWVFIWVEN